MRYKGSYYNISDTWYLNVNNTVHAFHLKLHDGENWNIGHIKTNDLLHFKRMRDVLETLPEEQYPDDCLGKFTGCAVEKDGLYYLYYTMRDKYRSEKIGLAISDDLEHFTEYEHNPVLTPDDNIFAVQAKGEKTDCRDMLIVYDSKTNKYFGYFVAMADIPKRGELGVIGVAQSDDLIHWSNQKIVYIPDFNGVVEVPNVFEMNGKWYMTLMTSTQYGAKGAVKDTNLNCYIIWTVCDTPDGCFKSTEDNVFIGSTRIDSGYALRCVNFKDRLYAMYIDRSEYGTSISLPKEVKLINGSVKPVYADILKALRTENFWKSPTFTRIPTAFAWPEVIAGEYSANDESVYITAHKNSLQAFKADGISVPSLETAFMLTGNFDEAGAVIYHSADSIEDKYLQRDKSGIWNSYVWNPYYISFNKLENTISLNEGMVNPICKRSFCFSENIKLHVRIIAGEGQLDIYINDILFIECGIKTESYLSPGLFTFSGNAEFKGFTVYELEK